MSQCIHFLQSNQILGNSLVANATIATLLFRTYRQFFKICGIA